MNKILFASFLFLVACTPPGNPTSTPPAITIFASPVTRPWLSDAFQCAQEHQLILSNVNDPTQAEIAIRMGELDTLKSLAYQIGRDDILIITHRENPLQNLSEEQVMALFSGDDPLVQIWVFAPDEDIQHIFARDILQSSALSPQAHLAFSPEQMLEALKSDKNAIGILPRRWKTEAVREVFSLSDVPILVLTKSEPQGASKELLDCLQKGPAQ